MATIQKVKRRSDFAYRVLIRQAGMKSAATEAGAIVDKKKSSQQGKGVASVLLFWPALFIIDDNSLEAQKYARLKGEYEAAEKAHRIKEC